MAIENVEVTHGAGTKIAVDQLTTGENVQYVKILDGTADSTTPLSLSGGAVPVTVSGSSTLIAVGNVASGTADSGNPVKVGGKYNASAPTLSDGQRGDLQLTVNGFLKAELASLLAGEDLTNNVMGTITKPIAASTYAYSSDNQMTQVTNRNSKSSAGNVFSVAVSNFSTKTIFFQLHNKASAPVQGDVPVLSIPVPIGSGSTIALFKLGREDFGEGGHYLSTGVSWAVSSSYGIFGDGTTAANHVVVVKYI